MAVIPWRGIRRSQSKARRHHPGHRERHGLQGRLGRLGRRVHLVRLAHQRHQVAGLRCHFMHGSGSRPKSTFQITRSLGRLLCFHLVYAEPADSLGESPMAIHHQGLPGQSADSVDLRTE